jgi:hypothetical protein
MEEVSAQNEPCKIVTMSLRRCLDPHSTPQDKGLKARVVGSANRESMQEITAQDAHRLSDFTASNDQGMHRICWTEFAYCCTLLGEAFVT